jgi:hypothetical protein
MKGLLAARPLALMSSGRASRLIVGPLVSLNDLGVVSKANYESAYGFPAV